MTVAYNEILRVYVQKYYPLSGNLFTDTCRYGSIYYGLDIKSDKNFYQYMGADKRNFYRDFFLQNIRTFQLQIQLSKCFMYI